MTRQTTAIIASGGALLGLMVLLPAARAVGRIADVQPTQRIHPSAAVCAARRMNRAAGVIAASVLADSALEHYRGSFHNKGMVAPLLSASLSLAVSLHGHTDKRPVAHAFRDLVYAAAGLTGLAGTCFHIFNIGKKPGGFCWQNLLYQAPLGAPAATSFGLLGTVFEAGLLHFRGSYQNPAMYLPVMLPPPSAVLTGMAALGATRHPRPWTRALLRLTSLMGLASAGFHIRGVARNMGGWRNWTQNLLNGPPIPAPPSFTGLALAGLAALGLMEDHPDD